MLRLCFMYFMRRKNNQPPQKLHQPQAHWQRECIYLKKNSFCKPKFCKMPKVAGIMTEDITIPSHQCLGTPNTKSLSSVQSHFWCQMQALKAWGISTISTNSPGALNLGLDTVQSGWHVTSNSSKSSLRWRILYVMKVKGSIYPQ